MKGLFSKLAVAAALAMLFSACGDDKRAEEAATQTESSAPAAQEAPATEQAADTQATEAPAPEAAEQAPADENAPAALENAQEPKDDMAQAPAEEAK